MNDQTALQIRALQLRQLLDMAGDDPVMVPQLRVRLEQAETELQAARQEEGALLPTENIVLPRAAIFLRGGGVEDTVGIRPALAGEALIQYEKMFTEQALHDEREAARSAGRQRRRRGTPTPGLLFTGTPRGSFGLELVPQPIKDDDLLQVHAQSLRHVAEALTLVIQGGPDSRETAIAKIPSRVLEHLKNFLNTLAHYGAELRLAFSDRPGQYMAADQVKKAAELLEREVRQVNVSLSGIFRGVTRESGWFDVKIQEGEVITGTIADDLTEDDLEQIDRLTNQACIVQMLKTEVRGVTGSATPSYVLLNARPATREPSS